METIKEFTPAANVAAPLLEPTLQEAAPPPPHRDMLFLAGIVLVAISALLFCIPMFWPQASHSHMSLFFGHYMLTASFAVTLWGKQIFVLRKAPEPYSGRYYMPLLVLLLISAYALNREMTVFHQSVPWLTGMLVLQCLAVLGIPFLSYLHKHVQLALFFGLGAGMVLFAYLAVYLLPLYLFSVPGLLALGISIHTFVPLFFLVTYFRVLRKHRRTNKQLQYAFLSGVLLAVSVATIYSAFWSYTSKTVNRAYGNSMLQNQDLPAWVRVSQKIPRNMLTERFLKSGNVYTVFNPGRNFLWSFPEVSFWEQRKHDPLVLIGSFFSKPVELSESERIKILRSVYDARHNAQERLWRGENLRTGRVLNNIRLWPEYRMAYTEKTLSIKNTSARSTWLTTEEALYTFHLPEGALVTSLSLWVNGVEQKGYLSSKQVADSAYRTIVGVEVRDPSLVHWQEGNTVTVRVFPVTPEEDRWVKIGITSPLELRGDQLLYRNIYFDGPLATDAEETREVNLGGGRMDGRPLNTEETSNGYRYEGELEPEWMIRVAATPLASGTFHFARNSYQLEPYKPALETVHWTRLYLDLNQAWTKEEVEQILALANGRKVRAWTGSTMQELTQQNLEQVLKEAQNLNYSLFPLHLIKEPETSLLITKTSGTTPTLSDLEGSEFYEKLMFANITKQPIRTFNLASEDLTPYLKTLREFRLIQCMQGNQEQLQNLITGNQFPQRAEQENELLIEPAGMLITRHETAAIGGVKAPDHLFRLFAYNKILSEAGVRATRKTFTDPFLLDLAQQANVVSPLSSLIVLETQKDYDRFNITRNPNSLGNASMNSSGAVPEPHEWALIILMAFAAAYLLYQNRLRQLWAR